MRSIRSSVAVAAVARLRSDSDVRDDLFVRISACADE